MKVTVRQRPDREHLQLAYTCPLTGRVKTKSSGTTRWKEAERAAERWENQLAGESGGDCSWEVFGDRFDFEYLADMKRNSAKEFNIAFRHFERIIGKVRSMRSIDAGVCSRFAAGLKDGGMKPATVAKTLRHFSAALRWAERVGIIPKAPRVAMPKLSGTRRAKGRPVTDAEFELILKAIPDDGHRPAWAKLLRGLWLSGLRLTEAIRLSWDSPPVLVDLSGRFPAIVFEADGQKSGKAERVVVTPDFAELLRETPAADRHGRVFKLPMTTANHIGRRLSEIGKASGVMTAEDKYATAHDLRRSFGTRWALRIHPLALRAIMRHADLKTTMAYYVDLDADKIGEELYTQMYKRGPSKRKSSK